MTPIEKITASRKLALDLKYESQIIQREIGEIESYLQQGKFKMEHNICISIPSWVNQPSSVLSWKFSDETCMWQFLVDGAQLVHMDAEVQLICIDHVGDIVKHIQEETNKLIDKA